MDGDCCGIGYAYPTCYGSPANKKKVKRHRIAPICTYIENMVKYDQAKK
ncbi:hypothetical protein DET54_10646 [Paenibacillus pabuli]|uniref:Uncharacterized protein n=1 Tax=Paenibacillus pabuli TaxID=1472 RepID=A0A855XQL6_9BACL|nr:hypothetical protein DET56_11246 [Paenibacillus pabuli]PXW02869.1 hypothetical protein DEU73_111179 [Paenibacillus taichungensis]RAI96690.1 hypothetical protein DET54_10646 [Paenibacillus pabuli]SEP07824.1 hypothetical protein SAMN05518670_5536 [Paenibacillus sp. OK076]